MACRSLSHRTLSSFYLFLCMFTSYTGMRRACHFCFLTFASISLLHSHLLLHVNSRKRPESYAKKLKKKLAQQHVRKPADKSQNTVNIIDLGSDVNNVPESCSKEWINRCSMCDFKPHNKQALLHHRRDHACVRKRHLKKLNSIGLLLNTSQPCSYCPWCSKRFTSVHSPKLHFVTHFLADAFICRKCDRRFVSGALCRRHIKLKHGLKKFKTRFILRYDLPLILQRRIGVKSVFSPEPPIEPVDSSNIPVEIFQLTEASQIPPSTFTEQLGQEVVWLAEPGSHISEVTQPSLIIVPPGLSHEQFTNAQVIPVDSSFSLEQSFQTSDMFLLPQGSTLDNLDSYSHGVFYNDQASFGDAPAFETDYQPTVDFVQDANSSLDFNTEVTIATEPPPLMAQESMNQQAGVTQLFGCCQCTARFDDSVTLSDHVISHATSARYSVCLACGTSRLDTGDVTLCNACGQNVLHQMEALLEDAVIGYARFYCTHCNLAFVELDHLEAHVAELTVSTMYQHQPMIEEEVVTAESVQPAIRSRRPVQPAKAHFELPAEELQKILQTQPAPESSLSERLLYEAAYERDHRSYPIGTRKPVDGPSTSSKERPHVCTVCSFRFQRSSDLHRHRFLHTGVRPYSCKFCNRRFILPRRLLAHATRLHGAEGLAWVTAFLSGRPRSRRLLLTSPTGSFTCHLCGNTCSSASSLHSHMRIHTGTKTYACSHCTLSFRTPIQRKRHLRVCPKRFIEPSTDLASTASPCFDLATLQQSSGFKDLLTADNLPPPLPQVSVVPPKYVKLDHESGTSSSYVSIWQCKHCLENFATNKAFANHDCTAQKVTPRTLHQLERGGTVEGSSGTRHSHHSCPTCPKTFSRSTDLRRHGRVHSNERPFVCKVCDARFSQSCSLRMHQRTHEETGRRFKCRICGAAFFVRSNMLRHMSRVHEALARGCSTVKTS